jgi:putative heme iron utilization protein
VAKRPAPPDEEAQEARALVARERHGVLCTVHAAEGAWPFGSVVPYAVQAGGDPVIWISTIAEHTRNLSVEPRCCLFVSDSSRLDDVQAAPRVALLARAAVLAGSAAATAGNTYFERFPRSRDMESAHGFSFHVLHVERVRWIAGFGSMGWLDRAGWTRATADLLEPYAAAIAEHLNEDHAEALAEFAAHVAGAKIAAARVTGVDTAGLTLDVTPAGRGAAPRSVFVPFPAPCATPDEARKAVIALLRDARKAR